MSSKYCNIGQGANEAFVCTNEQGERFVMNTAFRLKNQADGFGKWAAEIPFGMGTSVYNLGSQPNFYNTLDNAVDGNLGQISKLMASKIPKNLNMHGSVTLAINMQDSDAEQFNPEHAHNFKLIVSGHDVAAADEARTELLDKHKCDSEHALTTLINDVNSVLSGANDIEETNINSHNQSVIHEVNEYNATVNDNPLSKYRLISLVSPDEPGAPGECAEDFHSMTSQYFVNQLQPESVPINSKLLRTKCINTRQATRLMHDKLALDIANGLAQYGLDVQNSEITAPDFYNHLGIEETGDGGTMLHIGTNTGSKAISFQSPNKNITTQSIEKNTRAVAQSAAVKRKCLCVPSASDCNVHFATTLDGLDSELHEKLRASSAAPKMLFEDALEQAQDVQAAWSHCATKELPMTNNMIQIKANKNSYDKLKKHTTSSQMRELYTELNSADPESYFLHDAAPLGTTMCTAFQNPVSPLNGKYYGIVPLDSFENVLSGLHPSVDKIYVPNTAQWRENVMQLDEKQRSHLHLNSSNALYDSLGTCVGYHMPKPFEL